MYQLPYFKENNPEEVIDFIKQHPFAMVMGVDEDNKPVATQVPVLLKERDGFLYLVAHIMKQTDHYKAFLQNQNVLVVFTSPHIYVSASWYENKQQGSTWNYMSVHARGEIKYLDDERLFNLLNELTARFENNPASPSLYEHLPAEYIQRMSKAIVAFEIKITEIDNVFKLSQNRDAKSFDNIIEKLNQGNEDSRFIANEMVKRTEQLFG